MTLVDQRPGASAGAVNVPGVIRRSRVRHHWFGITLAALAALSLLMHLFRLDQSYDLFVDESFYSQVAQSVGRGHMPFANGSLFFLHPPGFFAVQALWLHLFGFHSAVFPQVWSFRKLVSLFDAASVPLVGLIVGKVAGKKAGLLAAFLFLTNTFVNRESSMVLLEPSSIFWALLGFVILLRAPAAGSRRVAGLIATGLAFGMSILSKEFGFFITFVPMVLTVLGARVFRRREALGASECALVGGLSLLPYACWVGVVVASGDWGAYRTQVTSGFRRAAGTSQLTGFNSAHAPSFLQTLLKDLSPLFSAYVVLAIGSLAIVYLVWRGDSPAHRLVAYFGIGALPLSLYCMTIGTNEEQFFDFLIAPALICAVAALWSRWSRLGEDLRLLATIVLTALIVSDVANYTVLHTSSDDGTYKVDRWMAEHVPPSTTVAVTNSVQREIFLRYNMVDDVNGATQLPEHAPYLVVFYGQVDQGYAFVSPDTVEAQIRHMRPVYSTTDDSNGQMTIYAARTR